MPPDEGTLAEIGLSEDALVSLLQTGTVDYIIMGIGFFQFQPGASDFAAVTPKQAALVDIVMTSLTVCVCR